MDMEHFKDVLQGISNLECKKHEPLCKDGEYPCPYYRFAKECLFVLLYHTIDLWENTIDLWEMTEE
jgi:hypothetical protein